MRDVPLDYISLKYCMLSHIIRATNSANSSRIIASSQSVGNNGFSASDVLGRFAGGISEKFCKFTLSLTANE